MVLIGLFSNDIADTMFGTDYRTEASTVMPCLALAIFIGSFMALLIVIILIMISATSSENTKSLIFFPFPHILTRFFLFFRN